VSIAVIIVNYNAGETLTACVNAVLKSADAIHVTVVDNASTDRSAENLNNLYGNQSAVSFLFNPTNRGFAPAVNTIARHVDAEWVLVLNPDCVVEHRAVAELQSALEDDPQAGLASPAVLDDAGRMQRANRRHFPDPWKSLMTTTGLWRLGRWIPGFSGIEAVHDGSQGEPEVCEAVSGACMLIRRDALKEIGYFDEQYAMHCEDLDLMFRLKLAGWHCLFVPRARCVHRQGLSSSSRPGWVHFQKHRGMLRFFKKFQADSHAFPVRWLVYAGIWLRCLALWPMSISKR
jgi:GT2 family glycosyltransferase